MDNLFEESEFVAVDDKKSAFLIEQIKTKKKFKRHTAIENKSSFYNSWFEFSNLVTYIIDLDLGTNWKEGIEIIKSIRKKDFSSPIIVYSAHINDKKIRSLCQESGASYLEQLGGESSNEIDRIDSFIETYYKKHNLILSRIIEQNNESIKKFYDCIVTEVSEKWVTLYIRDENMYTFTRKYDPGIVDVQGSIKLNKCYKMVEQNYQYGKNNLDFFSLPNNPFEIDGNELKNNLSFFINKK